MDGYICNERSYWDLKRLEKILEDAKSLQRQSLKEKFTTNNRTKRCVPSDSRISPSVSGPSKSLHYAMVQGRTFCFDVLISVTIFTRKKSAGGNMIGLNQQRKSHASSRSFGGWVRAHFPEQRLVIELMCTVESWLCSIRACWPVGHYHFCSWMTGEFIYFSFYLHLMKQVQIQQKDAFLLSTLTSVPKKYYIFNEKVSRNKMQGEIFLTNILKLFLWLRECFQLLALCHCSATQSFTLSMSSTCLFTNCGLLVGF